MLQPEKLFENLFDDERIIPSRLLNFSQDCLSRLVQNNPANVFTPLITPLTAAVDAFAAELSDVDTSLNVQVGATQTVDELIGSFRGYMSENEGVIAKAVGGKKSAAYLQFYPHGLSEYSKATKTALPTLLSRISTAATTFSAQLGVVLTGELTGFETAYNAARKQQLQQKGSVGSDRSQRSAARAAVEVLLLQAIYQVGNRFTADVQKCMSYFSFNMLFTQTQHKHQNLPGLLAVQQTQTVLNRTLTDNVKLTVANTGTNAPVFVWLAGTAKVEPSDTGVQVEPGHSADLKPSELGNLANTFLLIKNLSDVNEATYNVEVIG